MQIADDALEESFFTAGDRLADRTTQLDLLATADENRSRAVKALIVTGAILVVAVLLLSLLLPAPPSPAAHREPEHGAQR